MTSIRSFIKENRTELNRLVNEVMYRHDGRGGKGVIPDPAPRHNDEELRQWILNDEGLYRWARSEGVKI